MKLSLRFVLLIALVALVFGAPALVNLLTDWLWFTETGYEQVFLTMLWSRVALFAMAFVAAFVWLALNLRRAANDMGDLRRVFTTSDGIEFTMPGRRTIRGIAIAVAGIASLLVAIFAANQWRLWLLWREGVPFGEADPLLGYDAAFYVFSLPFLQFLRGLAQLLIVLAALGVAALHLLSGNLTSGYPATLDIAPRARRHLSFLAAAFFIVLAFGAWLGRFEYLTRAGGSIQGATYADVYGRMPAALLLVAVALVGAGLAMYQASTRRNWPIPVALGLYFAVSIGGELYSNALQRFVVSPNELARERQYIEYNIAATRRAFDLDRIDDVEISGEAVLTQADIANNRATLDNVRLWDHQPLLDTFGQLQVIRTYYDFVSVDNDRYQIDGNLRQIMLSVRELNVARLPSRTWVNERLTYTHGYGLTLGPVNQVTPRGLPVLFVQDLPPVTSAGLDIEEPSIYYGELSTDHVIVRTNQDEFHYPRGDDNVFTRYEGEGGVQLSSFWRKALYAARFGSYQILLSDDILPESRILYHRTIRERVGKIAPFLAFDQDPYMVLADGRLFWIHDAYTVSGRYPYADAADIAGPGPDGRGINYIRNSVKFVVDAFHGTVTAYLADESDPIAATYMRIFPGMFAPIAEMPAELRQHVRYPEDIFTVQSEMYATYHMTSPSVFYQREDQWEVPQIDDTTRMQPYYTIMRLPGEPEPEFIQMLPFTPRERQNLAAWLVARSDGDHYGRMRAFVFPKQTVIFGPRQVVARISQDQTIAPQVTLWNQQGSSVIWGTLMVIPIEESLIYVRPLYLRAGNSRIPELTRVVVAYGERIVMEPTLDMAIERMFGEGAAPARPPEQDDERLRQLSTREDNGDLAGAGDPNLAGLAAEAQAHYERAIAAQRAGDWARYGEELRLLGEILGRMRR